MLFFLKVLLAAVVIAFASWLSGKKPELSGFIIALPLASLIALVFSYLEHKNPETSITFAKSILIGVPISYLFFLPFFFAKSLGMNFVDLCDWCYLASCWICVASLYRLIILNLDI